jgi:hypothetical protein
MELVKFIEMLCFFEVDWCGAVVTGDWGVSGGFVYSVENILTTPPNLLK